MVVHLSNWLLGVMLVSVDMSTNILKYLKSITMFVNKLSPCVLEECPVRYAVFVLVKSTIHAFSLPAASARFNPVFFQLYTIVLQVAVTIASGPTDSWKECCSDGSVVTSG